MVHRGGSTWVHTFYSRLGIFSRPQRPRLHRSYNKNIQISFQSCKSLFYKCMFPKSFFCKAIQDQSTIVVALKFPIRSTPGSQSLLDGFTLFSRHSSVLQREDLSEIYCQFSQRHKSLFSGLFIVLGLILLMPGVY